MPVSRRWGKTVVPTVVKLGAIASRKRGRSRFPNKTFSLMSIAWGKRLSRSATQLPRWRSNLTTGLAWAFRDCITCVPKRSKIWKRACSKAIAQGPSPNTPCRIIRACSESAPARSWRGQRIHRVRVRQNGRGLKRFMSRCSISAVASRFSRGLVKTIPNRRDIPSNASWPSRPSTTTPSPRRANTIYRSISGITCEKASRSSPTALALSCGRLTAVRGSKPDRTFPSRTLQP